MPRATARLVGRNTQDQWSRVRTPSPARTGGATAGTDASGPARKAGIPHAVAGCVRAEGRRDLVLAQGMAMTVLREDQASGALFSISKQSLFDAEVCLQRLPWAVATRNPTVKRGTLGRDLVACVTESGYLVILVWSDRIEGLSKLAEFAMTPPRLGPREPRPRKLPRPLMAVDPRTNSIAAAAFEGTVSFFPSTVVAEAPFDESYVYHPQGTVSSLIFLDTNDDDDEHLLMLALALFDPMRQTHRLEILLVSHRTGRFEVFRQLPAPHDLLQLVAIPHQPHMFLTIHMGRIFAMSGDHPAFDRPAVSTVDASTLIASARILAAHAWRKEDQPDRCELLLTSDDGTAFVLCPDISWGAIEGGLELRSLADLGLHDDTHSGHRDVFPMDPHVGATMSAKTPIPTWLWLDV